MNDTKPIFVGTLGRAYQSYKRESMQSRTRYRLLSIEEQGFWHQKFDLSSHLWPHHRYFICSAHRYLSQKEIQSDLRCNSLQLIHTCACIWIFNPDVSHFLNCQQKLLIYLPIDGSYFYYSTIHQKIYGLTTTLFHDNFNIGISETKISKQMKLNCVFSMFVRNRN